jgi:mannose-6-phosphate isomerase-like protein (cupin superfamily)
MNNNIPLQTMQNAQDFGPEPYVVNIDEATRQNESFRSSLWTGTHLQVTLMSLDVNEDIGLEIHNNVDQFLRVEEGDGVVMMGNNQNNLDYQEEISDDYAIMIPAGKWHNIKNTGNIPLKLYSIYAPPAHPHGTVHETKEDAASTEKQSTY